MLDVLSALVPPAVVATVFCTFIVKLLRKEMAPRTSDGRLVNDADTASRPEAVNAGTEPSDDTGSVAKEGGAKGAEEASTEVPEDGPRSADR